MTERAIRGATGLTIVAVLLLLDAALLSRQARPPYGAEDALGTFRVADGFRIELFAAEPLVASPVAMEVDEHGRMFVAEMPGYPLDVGGSGNIVLLEDTTGDGLPDRRTVFAEGLRLPTGVMRWKNGLLVTDSPQVWYLEDTDEDGRADIKREVLTGFALSNPQHNTNTPLYGLDNWIYLANEGPVRTIKYQDIFGDRGGEVRYPAAPGAPRLPPNADGRNVRFRPDTHELEMLSARSQFGQTFDAWGRHFLVVHNRHVFHEVVAARYLQRNPALVVATAVEQLPDYPVPVALFPVTAEPEFQLLTDIGVMTAASGLTYYLADLFPPAYRRAVFAADSAHNLVHVSSLREHGATFRASRMFDDREFLASTDAWFRPVNFYLGPDGALYLIDYYRKIVEHPEWMDEAHSPADRDAGRDMGRIYRIAPATAPPPAWMNHIGLGGAPVPEIVQTLGHANIWWRRHAQRLLVDRRPPAAPALLSAAASDADSPTGRVHALWTLDGIGRLETHDLQRALQDSAPGVRENAIRLAELHLPRMPALREPLLTLADDPDPKVRFQLLLTLGDLMGPVPAALRSRLVIQDVEDPWMQVAALSSADLDVLGLFTEVVDRLRGTPTAGTRSLLTRLAAQAAAAAELDDARAILQRATTTAAEPRDAWWRAAALDGLVDGLPAGRRGTAELHADRERVAATLLAEHAPEVRRAGVRLIEAIGLPAGKVGATLVARAERLAGSQGADADARVDAIRLLARKDLPQYETLLHDLLNRPEPATVHIAAVNALAAPPGTSAAHAFIARWQRWTPSVRSEAVQALVREPGRVAVLLDAVEDGRVTVSEIDWPLRVRMMMSEGDELRRRARALFGAAPGAPRGAVARYQESARLAGSPSRGREVFTRTCASCHQYRGSGGIRYGPDLAELRGRLPSALVTDILHPNNSIADGYELWIAGLSDGTEASGIMSAETPTSVTLRQPGGTDTTIRRDRIVSLRIAPMSAMPEGLEASIDVQEMADLLAFIRGGD